MRHRFGLLLASSLSLLAASVLPAAAQVNPAAWPERPVRLVVPFPAGSATDIVARQLERGMSPALGQVIVVDNRSGASGSIGVDAVSKAAPDGYTIGLITVSTHAVAPALGRKLPYDTLGDFAPIGIIGSTPYVLVVFPGLGPTTVEALIKLARTRPGDIIYGSAGPASMAHLAAALLATEARLELLHVPYRSSANSVTDIMTGRIQMQFATIPPTLELITTGQLRVLATSGQRRSAALPNVPTVAETLPGFEATLWMGLVAPAGTHREIILRLNHELNAALGVQEIKELLMAQGVEPEPGRPAELADRIRADTRKWREVIQKAGIKAE